MTVAIITSIKVNPPVALLERRGGGGPTARPQTA
jgi:hypothetical protein